MYIIIHQSIWDLCGIWNHYFLFEALHDRKSYIFGTYLHMLASSSYYWKKEEGEQIQIMFSWNCIAYRNCYWFSTYPVCLLKHHIDLITTQFKFTKVSLQSPYSGSQYSPFSRSKTQLNLSLPGDYLNASVSEKIYSLWIVFLFLYLAFMLF